MKLGTTTAALLFTVRVWSQVVTLQDFGARTDGSAASNRQAVVAALTAPGVTSVHVSPGSYLVDNSSGPVVIEGFSGELLFEGGARLVFTDSRNGGIWFHGGTGARIRNLRVTYATAPSFRNSPQEAVKFSGVKDTALHDPLIEASPAAGILFYDSIRPRVTNAVIHNTLADGLHFANSQDAQVNGLSTFNTGDDGLAFVNYSKYPDRSGGVASNIVVRQSKARGITVVGTSDVVISDFLIDGTSSSGILCGSDPSYDTRSSDRVLISHGVIRNAGTVQPLVGNNYGIEYNGQKNCAFSDIEVDRPAGRGVGGLAPEGQVRLQNVRIRGNESGEGFSFFRTNVVEVVDSISEGSASYGFFFAQNGRVIVRGINSINSASHNSLGRAVWFENNRQVVGSDVTIVDDQTTPTGFVIGGYQDGATQVGVVRGVVSLIEHGGLQLLNNSGVQFLQ